MQAEWSAHTLWQSQLVCAGVDAGGIVSIWCVRCSCMMQAAAQTPFVASKVLPVEVGSGKCDFCFTLKQCYHCVDCTTDSTGCNIHGECRPHGGCDINDSAQPICFKAATGPAACSIPCPTSARPAITVQGLPLRQQQMH